jgi:hypothetical protein
VLAPAARVVALVSVFSLAVLAVVAALAAVLVSLVLAVLTVLDAPLVLAAGAGVAGAAVAGVVAAVDLDTPPDVLVPAVDAVFAAIGFAPVAPTFDVKPVAAELFIAAGANAIFLVVIFLELEVL